jgi:hypothetical protein
MRPLQGVANDNSPQQCSNVVVETTIPDRDVAVIVRIATIPDRDAAATHVVGCC